MQSTQTDAQKVIENQPSLLRRVIDAITSMVSAAASIISGGSKPPPTLTESPEPLTAKRLASHMVDTEKDPKKACTAFYRQMQREVNTLLRERLMKERRAKVQRVLDSLPWYVKLFVGKPIMALVSVMPWKLAVYAMLGIVAGAMVWQTVSTIWQAVLRAMVRSLGLG